MRWSVKAKVRKEANEGTYFTVLVPDEYLHMAIQKYTTDSFFTGELRLDDGRRITADQRKKAYATITDIADYTGYVPEEAKERMKYHYMIATDDDYFSLSDCSVTTASSFITFLIDFALEWGIPLSDPLIYRADDIGRAIYASLKHKRCIICGLEGECHHWDAIGMGRDRTEVDDSDLRKICLCRKCHGEAHNMGRDSFAKLYHVYGIIFNEEVIAV